MKSLKYIAAAMMLASAFAAGDVSAKRKMIPEAYIFGFSASFTDSVVYFTNVQAIDSTWIDSKTKFLLGRENYSYQLKDYFTHKQGQPARTCIVFYERKKKDIEKAFLKLKKKYTVKAKDMYDVRYIDGRDFMFKPVDMGIAEEE